MQVQRSWVLSLLLLGWRILSLGGTIVTALVDVAAYYTQNPNANLTISEAVFLALREIIFHPFR